MDNQKTYVPWRSSNGKTIVECLESKDTPALKEFAGDTPPVNIVDTGHNYFEIDMGKEPMMFGPKPIRFWNKDDALEFVELQMKMYAYFRKMEVEENAPAKR